MADKPINIVLGSLSTAEAEASSVVLRRGQCVFVYDLNRLYLGDGTSTIAQLVDNQIFAVPYPDLDALLQNYASLNHTHLSSQITDASTGGNGAADAWKLAEFNTEGQIRCSVHNSTTGALVAESTGTGYAGYFRASGNGTALRVVHGGAGAGIEVTADNGYATSLIVSSDVPLSVQRVNSTGDGSGRLAEFAATLSRTVELYVGFDGGLGWRALGTGAQTTANNLPAFGSATKGVVPASGGGTSNFLRADGTWAAPTVTPAASEVSNDSTVTGASVKDALDALDTADGLHDSSIATLTTAVNGKADASHTHTLSEITDAGAGANLDRLQVTVGSGQTTSSTTPVDITGCSLVLPANKTGSVTIRVLASNSSTSGGIGLTLNGSTAADYVAGRLDGHQSAGNYPVANITAFDGGTAAATVAIANTVYFYTANFDVVAGASPITLNARIFRGGSAGTITIRSARMTIQY